MLIPHADNGMGHGFPKKDHAQTLSLTRFAADAFLRRSSAVQVRGDQMAAQKR
jgi:hypothetical protein